MGLYLKARDDEEELALGDGENTKKPSNSVVHEVVNKRWEVCVTTSVKGFQQASFVNSIATTKVNTCLLCYETSLSLCYFSSAKVTHLQTIHTWVEQTLLLKCMCDKSLVLPVRVQNFCCFCLLNTEQSYKRQGSAHLKRSVCSNLICNGRRRCNGHAVDIKY